MPLLLREAIGDRLRRARTGQHRTLRDVSRAARVSLGYLSEVERGRKEASSELLAAICGALELPLADLLREVAHDLGNGAAPAFDRELHPDLPGDFDRELDRVIEGGRLVEAGTGDAKAQLRIPPRLTHRLTEPVTPVSSQPTAKLVAVVAA